MKELVGSVWQQSALRCRDKDTTTRGTFGPWSLRQVVQQYCMKSWEEAQKKVFVAVEGRNVTDVHTTRASCWLSHRAFIRPVSKENRHKPIPSTCSCCKEGNREKAIKEKKKRKNGTLPNGGVWWPKGSGCLLSRRRKVKGKAYIHMRGGPLPEKWKLSLVSIFFN